MQLNLLEILSCPFCGQSFQTTNTEIRDREIFWGILCCDCCAYPIIEGIPVLIANDLTKAVLKRLDTGDNEGALMTMLGLDKSRQDKFEQILSSRENATYSDCLKILSPHSEGTYFIYRFSDPTFILSQSIVQTLGKEGLNASKMPGRALDLCGGSGHLTRILSQLTAGTDVILADFYFWKLWLAKHFVAPAAQMICCDANNPLPFESKTFSFIICSDAFHYIWSKKLFSGEMIRLLHDNGILTLTHLHNSLCENFSAGMPLSPNGYSKLFADMDPRLFGDGNLLMNFITKKPIDLSQIVSTDELNQEKSLTLVATKRTEAFRVYNLIENFAKNGELHINPLYRAVPQDGKLILKLEFPSADYEQEYGECRGYIPETITLETDVIERLRPEEIDYLLERYVLLNLPHNYL